MTFFQAARVTLPRKRQFGADSQRSYNVTSRSKLRAGYGVCDVTASRSPGGLLGNGVHMWIVGQMRCREDIYGSGVDQLSSLKMYTTFISTLLSIIYYFVHSIH